MKKRNRARRVVLKSGVALGVLISVATASGLAWAALSNKPAGETNQFTAGVLNTPSVTTTHPNVSGSSDGNVTLTWTDTVTVDRTIIYNILRSAASPISYSTIATGTNVTLCTPTTGSVTCTYTDATAGYNSQYAYEIQSSVGSWSETSGADAALSLPPTAGTDTTGGPGSTLNSVRAIGASGTKAWVVGSSCAMEVTTDGKTWTKITLSVAVCPSGTNLTGVLVIDATHGWAVGSGGLILVCTATCTASTATWVKLTTEPTTQNLNGVTAVLNGTNYDVWAVGASNTVVYCAAANCSAAAATFTVINPTNLSGDTLNGVATFDGNEAWLVGTTSTGGVIAQCSSTANCDSASSTGWIVATSPTSQMNAIYPQAAALVYAVGNSGTVYVCTASCNLASPTFSSVSGTGAGTNNLTGVYVLSASATWLVGPGGFIDDCTATCSATSGGTWNTAFTSTTQNLDSVSGTGATDVWAVGANATIVSNITAVAGFPAETSAVSGSTLNSVRAIGASGTKAWVVGSSCAMEVTTDGKTWTKITLSVAVCPSGTNLTGVLVIDATHGWAVGSGGLILVCTATCTASTATWVKLTTEPTTQNLNGVTAVLNGTNYDVWAVGASNTVVYCAAANCSAAAATFTVINPTNLSGDTLNGVATFDGNEAWLVGTTSTGGVIAQCSSTANCDSASSTGWIVATSPTSQMNAIYPQAAALVYAVGNSGTVYVCTASCNLASPTFSSVSGTGAGTNNLTGVYVLSASATWLVGPGGFIDDCTATCSATSGGTWNTAFTSTTQNLDSVSGTGATDVWAVGANATIVSNITAVKGFPAETSGLSAYFLQAADITNISTPDGTNYSLQSAWTATSLPATCTATQGLEVSFSPTIPTGTGVTTTKATIVFTNTAKPSGAADQLLISGNSGSTWTAFSLTAPTANTVSTQTVAITSVIGSTTSLSNMEVCFQAVGSSSYSSSVDLLHVDVN